MKSSSRESRSAGVTSLIGLTAVLGSSVCASFATYAFAAAVSTASPYELCAGLLGRSIEGAVVTTAKLVAATGNAPEYCLVRGEMTPDLDFELRMPTAWNKRTVFAGGGGFDGSIFPPDNATLSPDLVTRRYAIIATNHGHNSASPADGSFALDPAMLADYGYLSVPRVLGPAKAILRERYGAAFEGTKMVYEGCSGGGRQGLIQAQRYPDLFDGVISRAPANAFTSQFLYYQQLQKQLAQPGAALSSAKIHAVSQAVIAKCDALDGLADNIIGRPDACHFDPAELACSGAETDSCLTPVQVQSARTFYGPASIANGRFTYPGFPVGGEVIGWGEPIRPLLAEGFMKYMVVRDPSVDWLKVDPAQYAVRIEQLATMIDAVNPDLSRFKARGGKLILWTGLSDWLITANNATAYYQSVVEESGGQAAADEFVEYYTAPSVQHCVGGSGADAVDLAGPMFEWLEKGMAPSKQHMVAARREFDAFGQRQSPAGQTRPSRPLCRYPQYPKYVGGDTNAAASFTCTSP